MNVPPVVLGLVIGVVIGAMDFSLARSITSLIRPSNAKAAQAIIVAGFAFRLAAVGILLWTLSRATDVNFVAVCIGLTGTFTFFTLRQAFISAGHTSRVQRQVTDRR
jgi:hypothetical protein